MLLFTNFWTHNSGSSLTLCLPVLVPLFHIFNVYCLKLCNSMMPLWFKKYSVSVRTVNIWKRVPVSVINANNINTFESRLDRFSLRNQKLTFGYKCTFTGTGNRSLVDNRSIAGSKMIPPPPPSVRHLRAGVIFYRPHLLAFLDFYFFTIAKPALALLFTLYWQTDLLLTIWPIFLVVDMSSC